MTRMEFLEAVASSPWYRLIGMRPRLEGDRVVVELEVGRRHHQAFGTAHGGVIAALLDSAIGLNVNVRVLPKRAVTVQLNIHYLRPVVEGKLTGVGEVLHLGKRAAVGYGEVTASGKKVAAGTATFYVVE